MDAVWVTDVVAAWLNALHAHPVDNLRQRTEERLGGGGAPPL
jgi:hypothetical protein